MLGDSGHFAIRGAPRAIVDYYVTGARGDPQAIGEFSCGSYGNLIAFSNTADIVVGHQMNTRTRSHAALARDAALARIGRTRRWLIVGAAGLTAGVAAFVSATAHGRTLHKGGATGVPVPSVSTSSVAPQMPPLANPSSLGLQGPVEDPQPPSSGSSGSGSSSPQSQAPAPAPAPAPSSSAAVSGGS